MPIKGFRVWLSGRLVENSENRFIQLLDQKGRLWEMEGTYGSGFYLQDPRSAKILMHTGTCDRYQNPIYEGDILRQVSCEQTFKVDDIVSFLLMCGRYEAKHGASIFDSLEIVSDEQ